jgi:heme/copper-type cytochrome/quinol oxidase subunit 2
MADDEIDSDAGQQWIEIRIENRAIMGDDVIRLIQGQDVALRWTTDEAAEVHIHGYDIRFDIAPDAPAEVEFSAHATGRYAVTSHGFAGEHSHGHDTLIYIEVYPD